MDSSLIRHNWKKIVISQIILLFFVLSLVTLTISVAAAIGPSGAESVAQEETEEPAAGDDLKPIGVGLAIGLAGLGAALGMGSAASAAAGAITEKPENFGRAVIFLVFIEAVAIYGLVVAILLIYG